MISYSKVFFQQLLVGNSPVCRAGRGQTHRGHTPGEEFLIQCLRLFSGSKNRPYIGGIEYHLKPVRNRVFYCAVRSAGYRAFRKNVPESNTVIKAHPPSAGNIPRKRLVQHPRQGTPETVLRVHIIKPKLPGFRRGHCPQNKNTGILIKHRRELMPGSGRFRTHSQRCGRRCVSSCRTRKPQRAAGFRNMLSAPQGCRTR